VTESAQCFRAANLSIPTIRLETLQHCISCADVLAGLVSYFDATEPSRPRRRVSSGFFQTLGVKPFWADFLAIEKPQAAAV